MFTFLRYIFREIALQPEYIRVEASAREFTRQLAYGHLISEIKKLVIDRQFPWYFL